MKTWKFIVAPTMFPTEMTFNYKAAMKPATNKTNTKKCKLKTNSKQFIIIQIETKNYLRPEREKAVEYTLAKGVNLSIFVAGTAHISQNRHNRTSLMLRLDINQTPFFAVCPERAQSFCDIGSGDGRFPSLLAALLSLVIFSLMIMVIGDGGGA